MNKQNSGVVLIKLSFVIFCLLLVTVGGPAFNSLSERENIAETRLNLWALRTAILNFSDDMGFVPQSMTSAISFLTNRNSLNLVKKAHTKKWRGPYITENIDQVLADTWNTKIRVEKFHKRLFLHSAGPDKVFTPIDQLIEYSPTYDMFETHDDIFIMIKELKS